MLAAIDGITMRQSRCLQFRSANKDQVEAALLFPDSKNNVCELVEHARCDSCTATGCAIAKGNENDSFLKSYKEVFFQPLSDLLELAVRKTWGIHSTFLEAGAPHPAVLPEGTSIDRFLKSNP
jgi:hypothetical protein